jgi:type III secretion protein L
MPFLTSAPGGDPAAPLRIAALGKVVRAADYAAVVDAQGLLDVARVRAAHIRADAEAAYQRECERGYADGARKARDEHAAAMIRLAEQTDAYLRGLEQDIADLVLTSVRKIVADFDSHERVLAVVRSGLALVRRQRQVLLRVHPEDAALVREHMDTLRASFPGMVDIDVAADDRYARGACRIETPIGVVETSLAEQLMAMQSALQQTAAAPQPSSSEGYADV